MNLILFEAGELAQPLPRSDPRAVHLLEVLKRRPGDTFDTGLINGPRGKGTLIGHDTESLTLAFAWGPPPPPLDPVTLMVGLPRPQTARKILLEATTLGVARLHFVTCAKTEPGYAQSTLWSSGEWRRHAVTGAEQAFDTRLPEITWQGTLETHVAALTNVGLRIALDVYEGASTLTAALPESPPDTPVVLALGPERGWGPADRAALRAHGFTLAHLGPRVLRLETAVVTALAVLKSRTGLL